MVRSFLSRLSGLVLFASIASVPAWSATLAPYLSVEPVVASWLPMQPKPGDVTDMADLAAYFETRPLAQVRSPSLANAEADDVLNANDVGARFSQAAGGPIDRQHAGKLLDVMDRVLQDDTLMLAPLKRDVSQGGRVRPYVRFPLQPVCKHDVDDEKWHLDETGSYPSGHATYGWMWGLVLSSILPERSDAIMIKAYAFGQSRLVCGFHYPSDLLAGRMAASALFARLSADPGFERDLLAARSQLWRSFGLAPDRNLRRRRH